MAWRGGTATAEECGRRVEMHKVARVGAQPFQAWVDATLNSDKP